VGEGRRQAEAWIVADQARRDDAQARHIAEEDAKAKEHQDHLDERRWHEEALAFAERARLDAVEARRLAEETEKAENRLREHDEGRREEETRATAERARAIEALRRAAADVRRDGDDDSEAAEDVSNSMLIARLRAYGRGEDPDRTTVV